MEKKYADSYQEVWEILKHISKEKYQKIPKKIIKRLRNNRNIESGFEYNPELSIEQQIISYDAKIILKIIFITCWASKEQTDLFFKNQEIEFGDSSFAKRKQYHLNQKRKQRKEDILYQFKRCNYIVEEKWYRKVKRIFAYQKEDENIG